MAVLRRAGAKGYAVVLCFIGVDGPEMSEERYPRTLNNRARAVREMPFEHGTMVEKHAPVPRWVPRGR